MSSICVICWEALANAPAILVQLNPNEPPDNEDQGVITTRCGHLYHRSCLENWLREKRPNGTCPTCKTRITTRKFQTVFPPETGENVEHLLEVEQEVSKDLRAQLQRCEKQRDEMRKKFVVENIAHELLKLEFTIKEVEVKNLQSQIQKIMSLHKTSQCTEKASRKRKKVLGIIDITGSDDERNNFTAVTLPPGSGFCIETRDLKTGGKTFVNFTVSEAVSGNPCVDFASLKESFYDAEGKAKVPIEIGKFYVGTFCGVQASIANVSVGADFFHFKAVTPEIIQHFFTYVAGDMLNEKGGLILDILHIKIIKNLRIRADFEGKENCTESSEKERLPEKVHNIKEETNVPSPIKKSKPAGKGELEMQLIEIILD